MKNVVVTGCSSFIGLSLAEKLIDKGYTVFAVIRQGSNKRTFLPKSANLKVVELDMCNYKNLGEYINVDSCSLFSLAWDGTRSLSRDDAERQRRNYEYSMDALESMKDKVKTVVSAGSQAEYGTINGKISERTVCSPNTEYGKWKLKYFYDAWEMCKNKGIAFKEPRFFSLYGPNDLTVLWLIRYLKKCLKMKIVILLSVLKCGILCI